jgi:hypothetical protein
MKDNAENSSVFALNTLNDVEMQTSSGVLNANEGELLTTTPAEIDADRV